MTSPLLPALLDVLDRADEGQVTLDRARLLQAAQALGTTHEPAVLEAAVAAHLADARPRVSAPTGFTWPWARPANRDEQSQRLAATHMLAELDSHTPQRRRVEQRFLGTGMGIGGGVGVLGSILLSLPYLHGGLWLRMFPLVLSICFGVCMLVGTLVGRMLFDQRDHRHRQQRGLYQPCDLALEDAAAYLAIPKARRLIQATLASDLPEILHGDVQVLEGYQEEVQAAARQTAKGTRQATRAARQATEAKRWSSKATQRQQVRQAQLRGLAEFLKQDSTEPAA